MLVAFGEGSVGHSTRWPREFMRPLDPAYVRDDWISARASTADVVRRARIGERPTEGSEKDPVVMMIDDMQPGDELRTFTNSREAWKRRHGRKGYVVMRDGKVIAAVLTALN
jgi:hypothetical protein